MKKCLAEILSVCKPIFVFGSGDKMLAGRRIGQYFDFVTLLGLGGIPFFRILLGSTFSWADLLCYGAGCALFYAGEKWIRSRIR